MENFDKYFNLTAVIMVAISSLIVTILAAVSDNDGDPTNDPKWQIVLRKIASVITRLFSFSTMRNEGNKTGFELKLPGMSATPTTDKAKKAAKGK